jgi:hypothetical protein
MGVMRVVDVCDVCVVPRSSVKRECDSTPTPWREPDTAVVHSRHARTAASDRVQPESRSGERGLNTGERFSRH